MTLRATTTMSHKEPESSCSPYLTASYTAENTAWLESNCERGNILDLGVFDPRLPFSLVMSGKNKVVGMVNSHQSLQMLSERTKYLPMQFQNQLQFHLNSASTLNQNFLDAYDVTILNHTFSNQPNFLKTIISALEKTKVNGKLLIVETIPIALPNKSSKQFSLAALITILASTCEIEEISLIGSYVRCKAQVKENIEANTALPLFTGLLEQLRKSQYLDFPFSHQFLDNTQTQLIQDLHRTSFNISRELKNSNESLRAARGREAQLLKLFEDSRTNIEDLNKRYRELELERHILKIENNQLKSWLENVHSSVMHLMLQSIKKPRLLRQNFPILARRLFRKAATKTDSHNPREIEYLLSQRMKETNSPSQVVELASHLMAKTPNSELVISRILCDMFRYTFEDQALIFARRALALNSSSPELVELIEKLQRRINQFEQVPQSDSLRTSAIPEGGLPDSLLLGNGRFASIRMAAILDTFSAFCFGPEFNSKFLSINNWEEEIQEFKPHFFLAESAWQGNDGQWKYLFNKFSQKPENELRNLLCWCRDNEVPTVFWNKEDPVNFDLFLPVAREFDYIFTTDEECVDKYKEKLGHNNVACLPFAAQAQVHNPTGCRQELIHAGCFAGAWRGSKYPSRARDFEILLDPLLEDEKLVIYDRYASHPDNRELGFPKKYQSAVHGSLPYNLLVDKYKAFSFFLNVNSVSESPTMFSRRVFELLACATPVISTPSLGIQSLLGESVLISNSEKATKQLADNLLKDEEYREKVGHLGYRTVMKEHTYSNRAYSLLKEIGLISEDFVTEPLVSVICVSKRPENLAQIIKNFECQAYTNKELILVTNHKDYSDNQVAGALTGIQNARHFHCSPEMTLAECLNEAIAVSQGEYWAKFDDDDLYGTNYLADSMLPFRYTDAAVVGKSSYYCYMSEMDLLAIRRPQKEFIYAPLVAGATLVVNKARTRHLAFKPVSRGTDSLFQQDCRTEGIKIYSCDRYNFVAIRHSHPTGHTWDISDREFLKNCEVIGRGLDEAAIFF